VALNTSALYAGQALGSALGGMMIARGQMLRLHEVGLVLMGLAMALSVWAARRAAATAPDQKRS
jgi:predicted MFS family arabinose efflux permease